MKEREEPNFFDGLEEMREKRESNRQAAYENKVCRKIIFRIYDKGDPEREYWNSRLEASSEPLAEIQDLLGKFCVRTHRMQQWSINDLLAPPNKIGRAHV